MEFLEEAMLIDDHYFTGICPRNVIKSNLAAVASSVGEADRAMALFEELLAFYKSSPCKALAEVGIILNNRGVTYLDMGEQFKGARDLEESLLILEQTVGKDHHYYATVANNLAYDALNERTPTKYIMRAA